MGFSFSWIACLNVLAKLLQVSWGSWVISWVSRDFPATCLDFPGTSLGFPGPSLVWISLEKKNSGQNVHKVVFQVGTILSNFSHKLFPEWKIENPCSCCFGYLLLLRNKRQIAQVGVQLQCLGMTIEAFTT
jgi:hypothetical protein